MNKKLLVVGSILAVVILVTVSFTSVVGFQTNSITKAKNSPLFTVRTKRAIRDENKDTLTCEYVRKDKGFTIPFPTYDIRNALLQKLIYKIRNLDKDSLNKLKELYPKYSPEVLKKYLTNLEEDKKNEPTGTACLFTESGGWECIFYGILLILLIMTIISDGILELIRIIICMISPVFKTDS